MINMSKKDVMDKADIYYEKLASLDLWLKEPSPPQKGWIRLYSPAVITGELTFKQLSNCHLSVFTELSVPFISGYTIVNTA